MSWASAAIARLRRGEGAAVRPRGHSMAGKVEDGNTVTLAPLGGRAPGARRRRAGCAHAAGSNLHLVKAVQGDRVLIGNNRGGTNGRVNRAAVYGIATRVEPTGR